MAIDWSNDDDGEWLNRWTLLHNFFSIFVNFTKSVSLGWICSLCFSQKFYGFVQHQRWWETSPLRDFLFCTNTHTHSRSLIHTIKMYFTMKCVCVSPVSMKFLVSSSSFSSSSFLVCWLIAFGATATAAGGCVLCYCVFAIFCRVNRWYLCMRLPLLPFNTNQKRPLLEFDRKFWKQLVNCAKRNRIFASYFVEYVLR